MIQHFWLPSLNCWDHDNIIKLYFSRDLNTLTSNPPSPDSDLLKQDYNFSPYGTSAMPHNAKLPSEFIAKMLPLATTHSYGSLALPALALTSYHQQIYFQN